MTTRLYIDIDGVLTASPEAWPDVSTYVMPCDEVEEGVIVVEADIVEIHEIFAQFDEVVWATSWSLRPKMLSYLESLLELPGYPSIDLREPEYLEERARHGQSGKYPAVVRHLPTASLDVDSLWIDDEISVTEAYKARVVYAVHTIVPGYDDGGIYTMQSHVERWLERHG